MSEQEGSKPIGGTYRLIRDGEASPDIPFDAELTADMLHEAAELLMIRKAEIRLEMLRLAEKEFSGFTSEQLRIASRQVYGESRDPDAP